MTRPSLGSPFREHHALSLMKNQRWNMGISLDALNSDAGSYALPYHHVLLEFPLPDILLRVSLGATGSQVLWALQWAAAENIRARFSPVIIMRISDTLSHRNCHIRIVDQRITPAF